MPTDEFGNTYDEGWVPESPHLRGETRTPDQVAHTGMPTQLDELPHRKRVEAGLNTEEPDPGYDPAQDDLL